MNVMDRLRAAEKQLGEIWKELTPFRGIAGGGGVAAHHLTHEPGGADEITVLPDHHTEHEPGGGDAITVLPSHHTTHESGGGDAIKLDDLAAPDNNTDLDVSITKHGLCPKAPNDTTKFLRGDASWQVPPAGGGGASIIEIQVFGG